MEVVKQLGITKPVVDAEKCVACGLCNELSPLFKKTPLEELGLRSLIYSVLEEKPNMYSFAQPLVPVNCPLRINLIDIIISARRIAQQHYKELDLPQEITILINEYKEKKRFSLKNLSMLF